jgi:hypothetical protein
MAQLAEPSMVAQPTIRRLSAALGAEVIDLDLARPLDAATIATVCAAIYTPPPAYHYPPPYY